MGAVRDALQLSEIRRIELAYGLAWTGEQAGGVALIVYAFNAGGAPLAAVYAAARSLPGVAVMLVLTGLASRVRRDSLLRQITGLRAALLAAAAVAAAFHLPPGVVIALAAASSTMSWTYRPLQAASLPWLVRTPAELTASSAVTSVMENFGRLGGPILAGGLLAVASPVAAMALAAGFLCVATARLHGLTVPIPPEVGGRPVARAIRDVTSGVAEFVRLAPPAGVVILHFAQRFVRGALVVLIAVLAVHLALGDSAVGWLNAALGAGGVLGGALAAAAVRVTRLARSYLAGMLLWALMLAVIALVPAPATAYLALVGAGIGVAFQDTGCYSLVTRLTGRAAGRVLSTMEMVGLAGLGTGSIVTPSLLNVLGVRGTFALLGAGLAGLALAHAVRFSRLDRAMPTPGPQIRLLRNLPMFAPLPLAVTELLAAETEPHQFPAGTVVMREGEAGDDLHVIVAGTAAVSVRGEPRPALHAGECFGEIALLRDVPRTATVTAEQPLRTLTLGREEFLTAVTGNSTSSAAVEALVAQRLATDAEGHGDLLPAHEPGADQAAGIEDSGHGLLALDPGADQPDLG